MIDTHLPIRGQAPNFGNTQLTCASRRHQSLVLGREVEGARLRSSGGVGTVYGHLVRKYCFFCSNESRIWSTVTKTALLTKCVLAYIAAAARTGAFHFAVKHQLWWQREAHVSCTYSRSLVLDARSGSVSSAH